MSSCPYCGRDDNISVISSPPILSHDNAEEKKKRSWSLCCNLCSGISKKHQSEIQDNSSANIRYVRRRTIQFQLDSNSSEKRNINKPRSSILKIIDNKEVKVLTCLFSSKPILNFDIKPTPK